LHDDARSLRAVSLRELDAMFDIRFSRLLDDEGGARVRQGLIVLGDYEEEFVSAIGDWSVADYERQWRTAVERVVGGISPSALVTSFIHPAPGVCELWWPMWRNGGNVVLQHQLLRTDDLSAPFTAADLYHHVPPHASTSRFGYKADEWQVSLGQLRDFLTRSAARSPTTVPRLHDLARDPHDERVAS
jgi:hypothetical protein